MIARWPSVTARCLTEDLNLRLPDPQVQRRADLDHPALQELRRLAPSTPQGQKAIAQLHDHGFHGFRLRFSNHRGCTWHDGNEDIVWLLAYALHQGGDEDDCYNYFEDLYSSQLLTPTNADVQAVRLEQLFHAQVPRFGKEVAGAIQDALYSPEVVVELDNEALLPVKVRVAVEPVDEEELVEIVVAFFHSTALDHRVAQVIHTLLLNEVSEILGLPPAEKWEVSTGYRYFPQAIATYVVIDQR